MQTTYWKCNGTRQNGKPCRWGYNPVEKIECNNRKCIKLRGEGDLAMSIIDIQLGVFVTQDLVEYDEEEKPYKTPYVSKQGETMIGSVFRQMADQRQGKLQQEEKERRQQQEREQQMEQQEREQQEREQQERKQKKKKK